jgi:hypothetical protein
VLFRSQALRKIRQQTHLDLDQPPHEHHQMIY